VTKRDVVRQVLDGERDVRRESRRLLDLGRDGGYIFSPSHAVEGDVPLENMLAFIHVARERAQ
jgi:uroporphyrinogen decarboxylase